MAIAMTTGQPTPRRQRGAVSVLVGVAIVMLLTMLGLVLDLGHLYVAKTELQNAADACALGAAWEIAPIDGTTLERATEAGIAVGTKNSIDFQSTAVDIQPGDITFSATLDDAGFTRNVSSATKYVRCTPHGSAGKSVVMWIMWLWGSQSSRVGASAIAGLQLCGFPLTFCTTDAAPTEANLFGFKEGSWYGGRAAPGSATHGNYGWIGGGGRDTLDLIAGGGDCEIVQDGQQIYVEGLEGNRAAAAARAFNTRFGVYAGTYREPDLYRPDWTGYAYTWDPASSYGSWPPPNTSPYGIWPPPGTPPPGPDPDASKPPCDTGSVSCNAYDSQRPALFPARQVAFAPFDPAQVVPSLPGNPRILSTPELQTYGVRDRRLVIVPVVRCEDWPAGNDPILVRGWACGLLTAPIRDSETVTLEFLGAARNSPCVGRALPGNATVPRLVR